jgi:PAS domain S-box-containing protein
VEAGSDAMLRAIVQSSVNPFVVLDPTGTVTWASDGVHSLLGTSPADHIGRHFLDIIAPSSHEAAIAEYSEFTNREHDRSWIGPPMLLELVHGDGGTITCEVSASTGTPHGIDGIIVQIRRWRGAVLLFAAVDALAAGAPLDAVLADIAAVAEHEMPGSALFVVTGPTGDRPQIVAAPPVTARSHPDLAQQVLAHLGSVDEPDVGGLDRLAAGAGFQACWAVPVTVRGDDGPNAQLVVMRSVVGPLGPNHTSVHRTVRLLALAIEAERNRLAWRRSAVTDPLTELANRSGLEEWLADRAERRPDDPIALLFCDVDEFKPVNDRLGHGAGDGGAARRGVERDGDRCGRDRGAHRLEQQPQPGPGGVRTPVGGDLDQQPLDDVGNRRLRAVTDDDDGRAGRLPPRAPRHHPSCSPTDPSGSR